MRRTTRTLLGLSMAGALAMSACSSDSKSASTTAAPAATTAASTAETTAASTAASTAETTAATTGASTAETTAGSSAASTPGSTDATTAASTDATTAGTTAAADPGGPVDLSLVAFSVPKEADEALEKAFAATPEGKDTTFTESYGASGDQSRAVVAGLKADIVHFSLESDVTRLVKEKLVADDWNAGPNKGIVSTSVVVIAVRPGNPKHITGWDDLIKDGIQIVTPNPGSSGSARWNILAAYGHVIANGGSEDDAKAYLTSFFKNTVALPGSGRDATTAFLAGTGDVLISYENEAILAKQSGAALDYVVPDQTLLIENPAAVTTDAAPRAKAFLDFALSDAGQTIFVQKGFRSLNNSITGVNVVGANDPANPFPTPKKLLTITGDFGGWTDAAKKYFDADTGIVTLIQQQTGKTS
ncbi:MAG: subI [Ilumatobacteraceae bacterium]|nr:subI [Ilumatobacteraceae bacterium]